MKYVMSDSRVYTDFSPNCSLNESLRSKYAPGSNEHQFRYALQRNADQIMKDMSGTNCKFCPVCQAALNYKPTGHVDQIQTNYKLSPPTQYGMLPNPNSLI